jgi:ribonuclease P protein component
VKNPGDPQRIEPPHPDERAPCVPQGARPDDVTAAPRDESFPRSHRLTREAQFRLLLARGFRHSTPHLVVHLLVNELGHSRLGLTVPRKVGNAVVRNRVRRRLREAFRRGWQFLLADHPADIMVRAVPPAGDATHACLEREGAAAIAAWRRSGFREGSRRPRGGPR